MTLITTKTSSGAASSDFTSGIDSTYKLYIFKYYDVNPATDNIEFSFQGNAAGQSGFNETMTTTFFRTNHPEDDAEAQIGYQDSFDQAQGTAYQFITYDQGNGGDESAAGTLWLFNPSNTTYVKHWYSRFSVYHAGSAENESYAAGYINDTTAIDEIQFKMSSGNFDGVIQLFGIA